MYKLFCMHPVVGREKEAYPASATATTHPYASLTFAIFSSLSTLCKITPSYACLWNGRASVMLSAATLWATSHMQFTDHTLTTVSPYVGGGREGRDRKKRRKKKKIKVARRVGKGKSTYCSSLVLFVLRLATFHRGTKRSRAFIELRMRHMKNL